MSVAAKSFVAASSFSLASATDEAGRAMIADVGAKLGGVPDLLLLYADAGHDLDALRRLFTEAWPGAALIGGTSCRGVMTEAGHHGAAQGRGAGVLALRDAAGAYGVAAASQGTDPRAAARGAVQQALERSGRPYETPSLVWVCASPGREEEVLAGIEDAVGPNVPVFGGSAADNDVSGHWRQVSRDGCFTDGVVVAVLFPGCRISYAFRSGYAPAGLTGRVTAVEGREILAIDGRPAADAYADWCPGVIDRAAGPDASILARSTWSPLGRIVGEIEGVPFHLLSHPARVTGRGGLELFSQVPEGAEIHLMQGTRTSLVGRIRRVAREAMDLAGMEAADVHGVVAIYCGGCMLAVEEHMGEVVANLAEAIPGVPFLGAFTFGEQGRSVSRANLHGNLMISVIVFGA